MKEQQLEDISPADTHLPDAVELRYPMAGIASRVTLSVLLAVGASMLFAAFLQAPLAAAVARVGEMTLIVAWMVLVGIFAGWVWRQSASFLLRADNEGILRTAGSERTTFSWTDVAAAEAIAPAETAGREATEGLYVVLRNASGEKLISLGYDISRGLAPEQVTRFKKYVRAQLSAHHIPREGPPLAWINWG